ncbi:cytochrome c3 family protein [Nitrosophilus alvini]|uniref:cytochrome c3 family protein n=1 Tax=Nitrosophilus alvini TaxID=2714855 RepID=UPI00190AB58F|nr:cytochrome c3 family protein [Nitrosophilus alvini]
MTDKNRKLALIGGLVLIMIFTAVAMSEVNFTRLVKINKNIMENIMEGTHHIFRNPNISVEYIKEHTGSSKTIDEKELPQAFKPVQKYKHPPFIMGACQVCHAPKRSKPAAILTPTVQDLCFECHIPVVQPKENINCNKCHNPHHAPKEHLIRKKVTAEKCPVGKFEY